MRRSAFTLIEMLVVIAIIGLLASILTPALGKAMSKARRIKCVSQLKAFHQAAVMHAGDNKTLLPAVCDERGFGGQYTWPGTWPFALAPYMGYGDIAPGTRIDTPRTNTIFTCPEYKGSGAFLFTAPNRRWDRGLLGGYGMNRNLDLARGVTPDGNWARQYITRGHLDADNASGRLLFADGSGNKGDLGTRFDFNSFGQATFKYLVDPTRHDGGANLCYLDGHVIFMREAMIVSRGLTGALFND